MIYSEYQFFTRDDVQRDAIISVLPDLGFEGFEELSDSIKAFIPQPAMNEAVLLETLKENNLSEVKFQSLLIQPKNWNEEWEKNFSPLLIAGQVSIRAPFHARQPAAYELIIEPKMSFGTGHHATTSMMIQQMLDMDIKGKSVVDFGSGTGILAILAEMLGASSVLAIDHEEWAIENSKENVERNGSKRISVLMADTMNVSHDQFDIMLANINRHVIMENLPFWRKFIKPHGVLVVSGILQADMDDIIGVAHSSVFFAEKTLMESGWISILFKSH